MDVLKRERALHASFRECMHESLYPHIWLPAVPIGPAVRHIF